MEIKVLLKDRHPGVLMLENLLKSRQANIKFLNSKEFTGYFQKLPVSIPFVFVRKKALINEILNNFEDVLTKQKYCDELMSRWISSFENSLDEVITTIHNEPSCMFVTGILVLDDFFTKARNIATSIELIFELYEKLNLRLRLAFFDRKLNFIYCIDEGKLIVEFTKIF